MRDSFAEGPLGDVDSGARSRVEWYRRINVDLRGDDFSWLWHLRDRPERLHEVALSARNVGCAVATIEPDILMKAWETRSRVVDVEARARRWELLRAEEGDFVRAIDGDEIVRLPITAFDGLILAAASTWTESTKVLETILADDVVGFAFSCWRIRELLREGSLESRGQTNSMQLPMELRRRER